MADAVRAAGNADTDWENEILPDGLPRMLTREQAWQLFDEAAREDLGMNGEEFVRRFDAGEWPDPDDDPRVIALVMRRPPGKPPSSTPTLNGA